MKNIAAVGLPRRLLSLSLLSILALHVCCDRVSASDYSRCQVYLSGSVYFDQVCAKTCGEIRDKSEPVDKAVELPLDGTHMHIPPKMTSLYDKFILFGDSITQGADSQERGFAWAAALRDDYIRKLEVVNHGLSGYNTDQAVKVFDRILPDPEYERVRFMTVFFGANDACWPTPVNNQSVPLPQYTANMIKILTHPALKVHSTRLVIITPPPVNEYMTWITDQAKGYANPRRTAEHTKEYADAAREVGKDLGIPVLDLWTSIMLRAGWKPSDDILPGSRALPENEVLAEMLRDGLHLSPVGYKVLYVDLLTLIRQVWPDQAPERLPFVLPSWDAKEGWSNYKNVPNE